MTLTPTTRDLSHMPLQERRQSNFDHPDSLDLALLAEHLGLLKQGTPVTKSIYDFTTHTRTGHTAVIEPAPVILVEGMLIFTSDRPRELCDLKVFLDEAADVRLLRRIRRDMAERGRSFTSVERQYLEQVRPMHARFVEPGKQHADIVISPGTAPDRTIARLIANMPYGAW